jgi:hypothetical protein
MVTPTQEAALAPDVQPSPMVVAPIEADVEPADTVGPLLPESKRAPAKQKVPRRPAAKPRKATPAASASTDVAEAPSFVADAAPNEEAPLEASEAHDISAAVDAMKKMARWNAQRDGRASAIRASALEDRRPAQARRPT